MDILPIIKKRCSIRKYKNKPIPKKALDKIIEAGIWGPSVPSFLRIQPWKFVVITNKKAISRLAEIVLRRSKKSVAGVNILLKAAANIIANAQAIIVVYKSSEMEKTKVKYKELSANFGDILDKAQLCAISASIQNMILVAESLKIGSCWLDMPLFCEREINKSLKIKERLVAFITLGYPAEKGERKVRKPFSETVKYHK